LLVSQTKAENRQHHWIYQICVLISDSKVDTSLTSMQLNLFHWLNL